MTRSVSARDELLLVQLDSIQKRAAKAQQEVSSGRRVNKASDAPDEVGEILALRASIDRNKQIGTNLERVKSETASADSALQQAITVLDRATTLATQGAGQVSADQRQVIAQEVQGLQEDLVALSGTSQSGRYLFSGDLDTQPCYRLNLAAPNGVDQLAAPQSTRLVEHPTGVSFAVSRTAQQIFDDRNPDGTPSGQNVFAAVNSLRVALEANDQPGVEAALLAVRGASTHLNTEAGFYGAVENRVASALDDVGTAGVNLKTALSSHEDADVTSAILEAQQAQISYSAALQLRGSNRQTSLFDYLK